MPESRRELYVKVGTVIVLVAGVSLLHYATQTNKPVLHDVYRRLYYLPVSLAAVWFGLRGGLVASGVVALAYAPHIAFQWHHAEREVVNQAMEIGLYFVVAGLVGYFSDQERRLRVHCQVAASSLDRSFQDLKRQADLIFEIEEQLRHADRLSAIGQLAAAMTHEVRNPLGAIKGTAEILRDEFPKGHPKAEFLEILLKETDRLNRVVEDFLGYARHRPVDERTEVVDLCALTRETATLVETQSRKSGVHLRLDLPEGLTVCGSYSQAKQVVLNLLLNAVQASPQGGTVGVRAEVQRGRVQGPEYREVASQLAVLTVEDEGDGVPAEVLPRLFEPFFTTKAEGTGLGLAISQRIAAALGGTLHAENRPGGGARFTLSLPLWSSSEEQDG